MASKTKQVSECIRGAAAWGRRSAPLLVVLILAASVVAPSVSGEFLNWDDDRFVVQNERVSSLTLDNVMYAFSGLRFESYQPLHLLSYMVDGFLWRKQALMYRLHNLALYLTGVFLLYYLLVRLKFESRPAFLGTLFFAVAPYHIESVAWVACRKDVLMLVWLLLAWHVHLAASGARYRWLLRSGAALLFVGALLSKSSALFFPVMVFAADVALRGKSWKSALRGIVLYLPPALLLGGVLPVIWSEASLIRDPTDASVLGRIMLVGWTLFHYGVTVLWPFRLSPLYAAPSESAIREGLILTGIAFTVGIAVLLSARKQGRSIWKPVGIGALTLAPILPFLNIVPMYYLVADRYLLLPSIGLAMALAAVASYAAEKRMQRLLLIVIIPFLVAMSIGAILESTHWRTSETLWRHATSVEPNAYYARLKYGETLRNNGKYSMSVRQYRKAKSIRPLSPLAIGGIFWGSLLQDAKSTSSGVDSPEKLVAHFLSIANNGPKLKSFALELRKKGFVRAAEVVGERLGQ